MWGWEEGHREEGLRGALSVVTQLSFKALAFEFGFNLRPIDAVLVGSDLEHVVLSLSSVAPLSQSKHHVDPLVQIRTHIVTL